MKISFINTKLFLIFLFGFYSFTFAQIDSIQLDEVVFQAKKKQAIGNIEIKANEAILTPSLTSSFTDILKTLPYVSVNTELSSQYMVRGGNYDENLVYVNGIEVYRPQLIRSGQQEGLNFLNPNMAAAVSFSAGGWEAKHGDKLSSVLDVIYHQPKNFELDTELSMMGGNITFGQATKDKKLSVLIGARYLNRSLILNTLDENTEFNPQSYDIQSSVEYQISPKWKLNFVGNFSNTLFEQIPNTRTTDFGTTQNPIRLTVHYAGKEEDKFMTKFGSLSVHHQLNKKVNLSLDFFSFHSIEQEYFDIQGAYFIRTLDKETGGATSTIDIGGQIDHARNDLDMLVAGVQHRGKYRFNVNNNLEWGITAQQESIKDLLNEWQLIDSAGYSINPQNPKPKLNPGEIDLSNFDINYSIQAKNELKSNRFNAYTQYNKKWNWNHAKVMLSMGIRAAYWDFNKEMNISPRAQIAIKPNWDSDQLFRLSGGYYVQPPFYKEIRNPEGEINEKIKPQKSIHAILGHDYEFDMWNRPFKLTTELYYKNIDDLIPYYIDNVRVKYYGKNNAVGRAYGIDTRLYGAFIPGADSWLSLSYARVEENIENKGWISRPTDPKFKASLFFQDYMPAFPSFKVNTTLVYASGLPNGAPIYANPYKFQSELPDYKRVDIGLTKIFKSREVDSNAKIFSYFKSFSLGLDIFNVFNIKNTVSNHWIRDVNTNRIYGVPNRLTGRFYNLKLRMSF